MTLQLTGYVGFAYPPPLSAGFRRETPKLGHLGAVPGKRAVHRVIVRTHMVPVRPMGARPWLQAVRNLYIVDDQDVSGRNALDQFHAVVERSVQLVESNFAGSDGVVGGKLGRTPNLIRFARPWTDPIGPTVADMGEQIARFSAFGVPRQHGHPGGSVPAGPFQEKDVIHCCSIHRVIAFSAHARCFQPGVPTDPVNPAYRVLNELPTTAPRRNPLVEAPSNTLGNVSE